MVGCTVTLPERPKRLLLDCAKSLRERSVVLLLL
jgi:hypothetical protein